MGLRIAQIAQQKILLILCYAHCSMSPSGEDKHTKKTKQEHTMLKIPLNSAILSQHKSAANNVNIKYKSKYDRKQFRHTECMFLTQDGNKLIYTTCPGVYAIRNWQN